MPRRPRSRTTEHYYHVINRGALKATLFKRPREYREFLAILRRGLRLHPIPLVAYCVLANHWHLVVGPTGTKRLAQLMHWVATTHAVRLRRRTNSVGHGPVYQSRYKSVPLEDAGSIVRACRYVERNALAAGLVARAQDWPWSSLVDRASMAPSMPLSGHDFLTSSAWVAFVNSTVTLREQLVERPVPKLLKPVENRPVPKQPDQVPRRPGVSPGDRAPRRESR
jgi:putative transposase